MDDCNNIKKRCDVCATLLVNELIRFAFRRSRENCEKEWRRCDHYKSQSYARMTRCTCSAMTVCMVDNWASLRSRCKGYWPSVLMDRDEVEQSWSIKDLLCEIKHQKNDFWSWGTKGEIPSGQSFILPAHEAVVVKRNLRTYRKKKTCEICS